MKTAAFLIACILLLSSVPTATAILSLRNTDVYPSAEYLRPGEMVNISATVEIIPSGSMTFASGHTLVFSTDMKNARWDIRVMVDGIQGAVIGKNTDHLFVNGYLLSYPTDRDVSVSVHLEGAAPENAERMPFSLLRVVELNNQGMIVGGSELDIMSIPASTTADKAVTDTVTKVPGKTPTTQLPLHVILSGLFCALLLLKKCL
jgi:hypothetical protein